MADTPAPYVPYVPSPGGPGYTITPSPSAPRATPAPQYNSVNESASPGYATAGVVSLAAARQRKDALTKSQKRAIKLAEKALKKGKYLRAATGLGKTFLKRVPYLGTAIVAFTWLPAKWRNKLISAVKRAPQDYVDAYRWYGGVQPMRRPRMAQHTVSRTSASLRRAAKVLKISPALPSLPSPRPGAPAGRRRTAGLPAPRKSLKTLPKFPPEPKFKAPKVSAGRAPSVPTLPAPRVSAPKSPTLRSPRGPISIPPWLSPLLTLATSRSPRIPSLPLTPNNPGSVASPFISSPPALGFAQALAPQTATAKCRCKRKKKRGCGSGYFKVTAGGRETYKYWSKSKCLPSKSKSA